MASSKQRLKWERWYDDVTARMNRQSKSITRLVLITTESQAALEQIANDPDIKSVKAARTRAAEALERIKDLAAAEVEDVEAIKADTPVEDPRERHG